MKINAKKVKLMSGENGNGAKTKQQKMMTIQHKDTYNCIQYKSTTKTQNSLREA